MLQVLSQALRKEKKSGESFEHVHVHGSEDRLYLVSLDAKKTYLN